MNNLKLNKLNLISQEMKNAVKGGDQVIICTCGCCGTSSDVDNTNANTAEGKKTKCDTVVGYGILVSKLIFSMTERLD